MLRKTLKASAWIAGGLLGVVVVVLVAAVAMNWRDQPTSPDAARLAALFESRPAVANGDNAFIYLLGFDTPVGEDPRAVGARRLAWLSPADGTPFDRAADPQVTRLEAASFDPAVERFLRVCADDTRECANAFADGDSVLERWTITNPWLLTRYRELIAHPGWREIIPDITQPLPTYVSALHGQRLLLLQARALANDGEVSAAVALLASDARFWRMVHESADLLITKMIAGAALRRHFDWGNLALRGLPPGRASSAIPLDWRTPMSTDELSLRRALVGEWAYLSASLPNMMGADFADERSFATRASSRLTRALFQPQDTLNRRAVYLTALMETLDAPLLGFGARADDASSLAHRTADEAVPLRSLYNITGRALLAEPFNYASYARRVADVEGIRRAALATATFRDEAIPAAALAAALAARPLRNPYDDQPLRWDESDQAVVFVGLEPGERGEHRFYY
jgi:hypothetical protein